MKRLNDLNQIRKNQDADTGIEASVEKDKVAITFTQVMFVLNTVTVDHAHKEKDVSEDILKDANTWPEDIVGEETHVCMFTIKMTLVKKRKKPDMTGKIGWRTKELTKMKNLRKSQVKLSLVKKRN
jgi:hypothetical protein